MRATCMQSSAICVPQLQRSRLFSNAPTARPNATRPPRSFSRSEPGSTRGRGGTSPQETIMSLAVAIQMDPMESINIDADSTFVLALEAQRRGHALWHYLPAHLSLRQGRLYARVRSLEVQRVHGAHFRLGAFETIDLATMDIVLMRQDPPFDMAYITSTHLLEHIQPRTLVVNDPVSVRNAPEKLLVTHFPELMPPTIVTWDVDAIRGFRATHKDIVVKPLFGNGGAGVFLMRHEDPNLGA